MMPTHEEIVLYGTYNDETTAQIVAENLWYDHKRKAMVMSVQEMHLYNHPLAPRTTNRFAVIAEKV